MSHICNIQIFRIKNTEFVTPLACSPDKEICKHKVGDLAIIVEDCVWVKNHNAKFVPKSGDIKSVYVKAVYSPAFVRINPSIFEEIF